MKRIIVLPVLAVLFVAGAIAKEKVTVKGNCEDVLTRSETLAAEYKWSSNRPDPKAMVLSISTSANFAKATFIPGGALFSHPKIGTLTFTQDGDSCSIESNGHPADVVAKQLGK